MSYVAKVGRTFAKTASKAETLGEFLFRQNKDCRRLAVLPLPAHEKVQMSGAGLENAHLDKRTLRMESILYLVRRI